MESKIEEKQDPNFDIEYEVETMNHYHSRNGSKVLDKSVEIRRDLILKKPKIRKLWMRHR